MKLKSSLIVVLTLVASDAFAAGFEVGENTALSNARGGTGVVSKSDPSATYFNPGRLAFTSDTQIMLDSNLVDLNLEFQRDPLVLPRETREFEPVRNQASPFPVPYFGASHELIEDKLTIGLTVQGPHAYGHRCFTEVVDGECQIDFENAGRHMIVGSNLLQVYFLLGVGYKIDMKRGSLGIGLAGGPAWQNNSLTLVVDQVGTNVGSPYREDPDSQAIFRAKSLQAWRPAFVGGIAWEADDGVRLGLSWRPPIAWEAQGNVELDLPEAVEELIELRGDELTLVTNQAGSLRFGWGYAMGKHPRFEERPLFDVEMNVVWENWSIVRSFETRPDIELVPAGIESQAQQLAPVVQPKNYQDAFSLRLGSTVAPLPWLSLHWGGFFETAAQSKANTNLDFVTWERAAGSLGFTLHTFSWLDVTSSFTFVHSPERRVTDGQVYSQIPLSQCTYPDYAEDACESKGTPPGNVQNNGVWRNSFLIYGLGLRSKF